MVQEEYPKREFSTKRYILALLTFFVILISCLIVVNAVIKHKTEKHQSMIQSSIKDGAPSVSLDAWCISGDVYVKNTNGKFVNISQKFKGMKCNDNGKMSQ